jgi:MFS family permease
MTSLIVAGVLLVAFVVIEALSHQPLMPLRMFANRNRAGAYALSLGTGATLSGMLFLLTLFLQNVLRLSPLQAGLAFLPTATGVIVGAAITSRVIGRIGPRPPMTIGPLLLSIGLLWLSGISVHASYASQVLGPLVVLSIGLGMVFVSTSVIGVSGVKPTESGVASALLNVGRQLGGSLGIAVLGTVAATVTTHQLAGGALTHAALSGAVTTGYATAFEIASAIAFAGFLIALVAVRNRRAAVTQQPEEVAA